MSKDLQSAVFLPLSAQTNDPETVTWCRGVPLLIAEELQRIQVARASFAAWTIGRGASLRLAHLQTAPQAEHVAAYARAARARVGISGWGSWQGDPFLRWEVVEHDGDTLRKVPVDTRGGASRMEVVQSAFETAKLMLGLMDDRVPPVLGATDSDQALLAWIQDRLQVWSRQRRGLTGSYDGEYRFLLSALTFDPGFHPAARVVIRRAGSALAAPDNGAAGRASEALFALLRVRPDDHLSWTLLGMLHRAQAQDEDAITAFRRSAALNPEYAPRTVSSAGCSWRRAISGPRAPTCARQASSRRRTLRSRWAWATSTWPSRTAAVPPSLPSSSTTPPTFLSDPPIRLPPHTTTPHHSLPLVHAAFLRVPGRLIAQIPT